MGGVYFFGSIAGKPSICLAFGTSENYVSPIDISRTTWRTAPSLVDAQNQDFQIDRIVGAQIQRSKCAIH